MRKRINKNAVCSSENYKTSKRVHQELLRENHESFCMMVVSGEIKINVSASPKFKTIKVFGKDIRVSIEDYNNHCKALGL